MITITCLIFSIPVLAVVDGLDELDDAVVAGVDVARPDEHAWIVPATSSTNALNTTLAR
jgi:hypothetical protein